MTIDTQKLREIAARSNDGDLRGPALDAANTIDAQAAEIAHQKGVFDILARSVAAALGRHGVTNGDDPGEAIDVLVAEKDAEIARLREALQKQKEAAIAWFLDEFDDETLEQMRRAGIIKQEYGFRVSCRASLEGDLEEAARAALSQGEPE